jgi:hypothetical protein
VDLVRAAVSGRVRVAALLALTCALLPADALASGGSYRIDGGTQRQQAQVRLALDASAFDWSILPTVDIAIREGSGSYSLPGQITLEAKLLDAGIFSWAVVQDEYAHQVDYLLLGERERSVLNQALLGRVWCHADEPGLAHGDYGCERFTSTFVWAFWPVRQNTYRPSSRNDESAAMAPGAFRALLQQLIAPIAALRVRAGHTAVR